MRRWAYVLAAAAPLRHSAPMPWHTKPPVMETIAFLPRTAPRRAWRRLAAPVGAVGVVVVFLLLAGPLTAFLLRLATIALSIALIAGVIAYAAFRIGIAPHARARRPG